MDETLRQVGELLLRAIPTVILFVILYVSYRLLVHNRLVEVLSERRALTEGALERARADIAAAEARTAEYERSIREAKIVLYKARESRRQKALEARAAAIAEARAAADARIREARAAIQNDVAQAKRTLQSEAESLAAEIIRSILKPATFAQAPAGIRQS
jgi:F-type H+-transporting ATPase subunit b